MTQVRDTPSPTDNAEPVLPTRRQLDDRIDRVMRMSHKDRTRRDFYQINHLFLQIALVEGWQAAIERAATLIDVLIDAQQWEAISAHHAKTLQILLGISKQKPTTFLDVYIKDLAAGRLAAAVRGYGLIQTERLSGFSKYRQNLKDGPERGLAIWQVMNPFYYAWSMLPAFGIKVSDRWREGEFNNLRDATSIVRASLSDNAKLLINVLRDECTDIDWPSARVLECGSGHGANANLLIRELGVAPPNYFGFDLHSSRAEVTRDVVRLLSTPDTDHGELECRIFELDILADTACGLLKNLGRVDLVFSASFTNVFDDEQLKTVLGRISAIAPRYIVDVSVITSWALCFGRCDLSELFAEIGYRLKSSKFEIPEISGDEGHRVWFPEKAWGNRNILVYERVDTRG